MASYAKKHIILREPIGGKIHMKGGSNNRFLWASDNFDKRFEGFVLQNTKRSKPSLQTGAMDYHLMHFERE